MIETARAGTPRRVLCYLPFGIYVCPPLQSRSSFLSLQFLFDWTFVVDEISFRAARRYQVGNDAWGRPVRPAGLTRLCLVCGLGFQMLVFHRATCFLTTPLQFMQRYWVSEYFFFLAAVDEGDAGTRRLQAWPCVCLHRPGRGRLLGKPLGWPSLVLCFLGFS